MNTERLTTSEVARRLLERPAPKSEKPRFAARAVKGVGGATVHEWDVDVPTCDEYPTAEEAFMATMRFARRFRDEFEPRDNLAAELAASVEPDEVAKRRKTAAKAAAIASKA